MSEEKPKQTRVNELGSENLWYVMMTIAGEQLKISIDAKLHKKNRRYWNGWVAHKFLSEDEKNALISEGRATAKDLARLTDKENEFINSVTESRCPSQKWMLDERHINFSNNEFPNDFCCDGFIFPYFVNFLGATFSGKANFNKATFSDTAWFNNATFLGGAEFSKATFLGWAEFSKATFSQLTLFYKARFLKWADFKEATFSGRAWFNNATFENGVEFQDSKFKSATNFRNAEFLESPPEFYNATLHEDTDWTDIKWPEAPKKREQAIEYRRAYERLKLIMARQNKFSDEHFFLRQELRCREIENPETLVTFFSRFYRWFSDYGWLVGRPFIALFAVWLIGGLSIYSIELLACKCINFWQSMGISAYNTFPFFHDTYFQDISLSRFSIIVSELQTVLGLVFLFLLGLGLRNRFRIK